MRRRSLAMRTQGVNNTAGLERWLVSYADYMTLVFALFVVLYAIQATKTELQQPMLDGIDQALVRLSGEAQSDQTATAMVETRSDKVPAGNGVQSNESDPGLAELKAQLELHLSPLLERQVVELELEGDWLTLSFDGQLLFASGSALLGGNTKPVLGRLMPVLTPGTHFIRVRGYADHLPVSNELYASNWQLSAERARAVLEWLLREGIQGPRLALEAYGEFRPLNTQPGAAGRARNRRVDIAISRHQWQDPAALPSRPLGTESHPELRVYDLPGGGIRIATEH
ncbi:OmpA/MotB family protein [Oceanisphaera sp.]|uniref:OmpA/MotB family protein n=1 Tax=Oceanisphaera sp. TaxID=1929979 RepID=UPI003A90AE5D